LRSGRTTSLVGAAVTLVGATVLSGMGGIAAAAPHSNPPSQPTGFVAQAVNTESARLVGTTSLAFGGAAGGGQPASGSTLLPGSVPAGHQPHTPDVGDAASSTTTKHSSLSRTSLKANGADPTVTGQTEAGPTPNLTHGIAGNDGYDQGVTHPFYDSTGAPEALPGVDVEPPDQGVCAGNGFVMEINNMVAKVFNSDLTGGTQAAPVESLFATPEIFGGANDGSFSIQGDPRCFYDSSSGRWFASQLWLDENDATSFGWAGTFVAVSTSGDPRGTWKDYFIPDAYNSTGTATCNNVASDSTSPAPNPCFGDQPLLGIDGASVQISTNEYSINNQTPNGPAGLYFLSKQAMVNGAASVNVLFSAVGASVAVPASNGPWYSLTPAQAPDGDYNAANNGTSYALSALDFAGSGDNRIAEWAYTNTGGVNSNNGKVNIYELTLSSGMYAVPPLPTVVQKTGSVPLAVYWNRLNGSKKNTPLPEGGIATNDDRMASVALDPSSGALVGALNTGVNQPRSGSTSQTLGGVAYFVVTPQLGASGLTASSVTTGYIAPAGADAVFPAVAVTSSGAGVISYSLVGTGYYPSQAYSVVSAGDSVGTTVHVARAGLGPQDGFSEYQDLGDSLYSPRWGDYGAAVATGSTITFANEMINQTCTASQFAQDFTCGGTRDLFINWGTGVATLNEG
jgi:hypothetical protein